MKHIFICIISIILLGFCFVSCAARIDGSVAANGSASITVSVSLMPRMASMIQSFAAASGQADGPVLNGPEIAQSMASAPGIESVAFRNTFSTSIEGQIKVSQIGEFLASEGEGFISFQQQAGRGRIGININLENGPEILEKLSPEISDYLNALMAPIVTGEEMSKEDYIELIATFYNKAISEEIADSKIRASIEFPGSITSIRGGTFSGRRANFEIPLVDLLVLEMPLIYEVMW